MQNKIFVRTDKRIKVMVKYPNKSYRGLWILDTDEEFEKILGAKPNGRHLTPNLGVWSGDIDKSEFTYENKNLLDRNEDNNSAGIIYGPIIITEIKETDKIIKNVSMKNFNKAFLYMLERFYDFWHNKEIKFVPSGI